MKRLDSTPSSRNRLGSTRLPAWVGLLAVVPAAFALANSEAEDAAATGGDVVVVEVDSIINPVVAEFLTEAIEEADADGADLVLVELNTPGGLMASMQEINTAILEAETPVVVYVSPRGAAAASAGFYILMAADKAAMAPGTNTGAAHPVGPQGQDIEGTMGEKVEQDAAARIRALAARNGRDQALAESAVIESRSFSAEEALELGLVDFVAADRNELLSKLDGLTVEKTEGEPKVLELGAAPSIRELEMSSLQRIRNALVHPNVLAILLSLGTLGLMVELWNPGAIIPGVVGVICLILAFYGASVLPVNYAGVALFILAMVLFVAEIKVQSFGFLTLAGVTCLVLGSLMLFKSADPAIQVSRQLIVIIAVLSLLVMAALFSLVVRVHRSQVSTGPEGLMAERGLTRSALDLGGKVDVHGEIWNAVADQPIPEGTAVEVVGVEGMTLRVRPVRAG